MVEGAGRENRQTRKVLAGSNPSSRPECCFDNQRFRVLPISNLIFARAPIGESVADQVSNSAEDVLFLIKTVDIPFRLKPPESYRLMFLPLRERSS